MSSPDGSMGASPPLVLAISGSDPSGGAGLEADLKTLQRHGVHGMAVCTLLTAQNSVGVRNVKFMEPDFLEEQIDALLEDLFPAVIKIGALGSLRTLQAVTRILSREQLRGVKVVIDTVFHSTSGQALFDARGLHDFIGRLLPLAHVITPNLSEFSLISGRNASESEAGAQLLEFGRDKPYAILLKGGHLPDEPVDFLYSDHSVSSFTSPRLDAQTHGTGCALASAVAANLALGLDLTSAVAKAKAYVHRAIATGFAVGKGMRMLNFNVEP